MEGDQTVEQRFRQALEVISSLQGQINELNVRIAQQERIMVLQNSLNSSYGHTY